MAWDVAEMQDQVQVITGHDGLNARVLEWVNRVLQQITKKAFWNKQVKQLSLDSRGAVTTDIDDTWVDGGDLGLANAIAVHRLDFTGQNTLLRGSLQALYAKFSGLIISYTSGTDVTHYSIARWIEAGAGAARYMKPEIAMFPLGASAGGDDNLYQAHYLAAPDKLTGAGDTFWMMTKYPNVVLAGVLRLAFVFLGDFQSYGIWKAQFLNGIQRMLMSEETSVASTPQFRGVYPEILTRGV
jgi:hypothetical protein